MKANAFKNLVNCNDEIICCICGFPICNRKEISKEHEPPLSRGGHKLQWKYAHKSCNNAKGALTADEYSEWKRLENIRHGR